MSKKTDVVMDYFAEGGKFVTGLAIRLFGESLNLVGDEAFSDALDIGIANTIAALYDADVADEEITRVLNKYWGINNEDAEYRLINEKRQAAIRELRRYLKMQGYSVKDISNFMASNRASIKIRTSNELWKLRRKPEKLMKEIQGLE